MTFLNIILLGGLAAASIPIIIHLINRNRFRVIKWGAMHLLDAALKENTRRLQLEQLLLLLVRIMIPTLLALALARPVMKGIEALVGSAKSSQVILLDNSYSMEAGGRANGSFARARQETAELLDGVAGGSDVAIMLMAGDGGMLLDQPTFDHARLSRELTATDAGFGKADVPKSLEAAVGTIAKMQHPYREIIVVSDFQTISWPEDEAGERLRIMQILKESPLPPRITFMQVGASDPENVSVESLDFARLILGVGQPINVRANIRNYGNRTYSTLQVYFRVDGVERKRTQISIGPNEEQQVLFVHDFDKAGSHVIEVFADADTLSADNAYSASLPVWDRVPVLLVSGDSNPQPLLGETDFLEIALRPYGEAKSDLRDLIEPRVISPEELNMAELEKVRVVVLANVRELSNGQYKSLQQFVREGGGLIVFPGDRINLQWHNQVMNVADGGLLPLPWKALSGSINDSAAATRIVSGNYTHTALELFNDPRNGNLGDGEINLWHKMEMRSGDTSTTLIARLESGDPFLVEKKYGEGRIIQCATTCDRDWNNLYARTFYLPLMQQLVTYLASTVYPPRNVDVGQSLAAIFPKQAAGKTARVTDPAGETHEITITSKEERALSEFAETQRPGKYVMVGPDNEPIHFVVNTSREESDLRRLDKSAVAAMAEDLGAAFVGSGKEHAQLDEHRRFGREIWRPIFWAVLVLIFFELYLQQRIGDKR